MGELGARKVALFLSLLEPSTVETLMGFFDPDVARKVAEEARNIRPEDLYYDESLVEDFLDAFSESELGAEGARLIAEEARRNARKYDLTSEAGRNEEGAEDDEEEPVSILERVSPELLNSALEGERNAIRAVVASRVSSRARRGLTERWTREEREKTSLYAEALGGFSDDCQDGVRRLEDVLFERTFDYE